MAMRDDPRYLFSLRYRLASGSIVIHAWEGGFQQPNHTRIDCELRQNGKVIFARGDTYCGTPGCVDDNAAKELVSSLFAMTPRDTDREFFEGYSQDQIDWAYANGEELGFLSQCRYCDENGNVR
jgi:hypothetical protein